MFSQINHYLSKKIEFSDGVTTYGYALIVRVILFLVTVSWIALYPAYLLMIHLRVEGFFSYDIFVAGLFSVKSFLFLVFIFISISALYMWGFLLVFKRAIWTRKTETWLTAFVFLGASILFHWAAFTSDLILEQPKRLLWFSILGFTLAVAVSPYLGNPLKSLVSNWFAPLFGIIASATLPLLFIGTTSEIVKTGLQNFRIGGGIQVAIHKIDNNELIKTGRLLLLTPDHIYLRGAGQGYASIARYNDIYVIVD